MEDQEQIKENLPTSSVDPKSSCDEGSTLSGLPAELRQLLGSNWAAIEADTVKLLQKLIRVDTQNFQEEGTEIEAVRLLEEVFQEAGIDYEVVEPKPGRGNIVARIPATARGGNNKEGALLLSAHLDTVKAPKENWEAEGWKHDPYGGIIDEEDGCLYGRGAIDMKQMAAMSVTLLCFVKKHGIALSRDLVFAGLADEERTDSTWGVRYLVEHRPDLVEADIVFNEVGGFTLHLQGVECVSVQIAEKGSMAVRITARGPGGHASLSHAANPVATVGDVARTLHATKLPLRVNTANAATVESLASCLPFPKSMVFRRILNPYLSDVIMSRLVPPALQGTLSPLLRNTATPTSIGGGGGQNNQIPSSAWVQIDARILPECTEEDVVADIKYVLGASRFEPPLVASPPPPPPLPSSPTTQGQEEEGEVEEEKGVGQEEEGVGQEEEGQQQQQQHAELELEVLKSRGPCWQDPKEPRCAEALEVIRKVVRDRTDGAPLCTVMIPGATDSYWYSRHPTKTPTCLGFTPVRFEADLKFSDLFHGVNERVPLAGLRWGVRVFADVVLMLCRAKPQ